MTEADFERLFWEELDGPPSATRQKRLEALVRERPEAERELQQLQEFAGLLEAVDEVAPPLELRAGVRQAVASRPAHDRGAATASGSWLRSLLAASWQTRLAYATLGALIGVFGVQLFVAGPTSVTEVDRSRLSGSLNVQEAPRPLEITLDGSAGELRLAPDGDNLIATLEPAPSQRLELILSREGGRLEPLRIDRIRAARHEIEAGPGTVRLVADGPLSVVLGVGGSWPASVAARVSTAGGATVLERRLELTTQGGAK